MRNRVEDKSCPLSMDSLSRHVSVEYSLQSLFIGVDDSLFDDCGVEAETLKSWIQKNPNVLGDRVLEKWGCDLPFLFKVLSVGKPLSIQAHPDKVSAEKLHKLHPDIYKDGNHKPEIAFALTDFEALYGFLEIKDFKDTLLKLPEIECIVGDPLLLSLFHSPEERDQYMPVCILQLPSSLFPNPVVVQSCVIRLADHLSVSSSFNNFTL